VFVCVLWVCYHDNSKSYASIFTKLHGTVGVGSDRLQLIKFWPSCAPGKGSAAGGGNLVPPYYSQRAVFASLWALFHFFLCFRLSHVHCDCISVSANCIYTVRQKNCTLFIYSITLSKRCWLVIWSFNSRWADLTSRQNNGRTVMQALNNMTNSQLRKMLKVFWWNFWIHFYWSNRV